MSWIVLMDDTWIIPRWMAREFVSRTEKTVWYLTKDGEKKRKNITAVKAKDLNQKYDEILANLLNQSRFICEEKQKEAAREHDARIRDLLEKAKKGDVLWTN